MVQGEQNVDEAGESIISLISLFSHFNIISMICILRPSPEIECVQCNSVCPPLGVVLSFVTSAWKRKAQAFSAAVSVVVCIYVRELVCLQKSV